MSEKPIIFSTPMVQAILEGRKTMTRRVVNPQPPLGLIPLGWCIEGKKKRIGSLSFVDPNMNCFVKFFAKPKYKIGDVLWVRETWRMGNSINELLPLKYYYKASSPSITNWKPSIFMPRTLARLFLKVTDVRVEQLQDISEEDAEREGVEQLELMQLKQIPNSLYVKIKNQTILPDCSHKAGFYNLWDTLNDKRGYAWGSNPWVWVISFERVNI